MQYNDDAFSTMLLMSQINPSREELVRPLSVSEWHQLHESVIHSNIHSMGGLLRADMSELQFTLGCSEDDAYRLCVLLGRTLQLSISMEQFRAKGIDLLTHDKREYPMALREVLGDKAPPMLYLAGRPELFRQPAIAILGALTPRGDTEARVRELVHAASQAGYVILLDGRNGLGLIALDELREVGGRAILVMAGELSETLAKPNIAALVSERRIALTSNFHPDAPYTLSHATQMSKCMYALSQAVFVFACDQDKGSTWLGATEALRSKWCRYIYSFDTDEYGGNRALISRGAIPMPDLRRMPFEELVANWISAAAEQTCLFDWDEPRRM